MTLTWWSLRGAQRRSNPEGSQPVRAIDSLMGTSSLPGEIVSGCRRTSGGDRRQVPATSVFENTPVAGHQCGIRHPRRGDDQPVSRVTMKYVWESVAFDRDLPLGHPVTLAQTLSWVAPVHIFRHEPSAVADCAERALKICEEHAQLAIGKPEAALASVAAGLNAVEKSGGAPLEAELYRLRGEALLAGAGTVSDAEAAIEKGIDVARRQNAKSWELRGAMSLARLGRQQGRHQEAMALLARSTARSPKASIPLTAKRPRSCSTNSLSRRLPQRGE